MGTTLKIDTMGPIYKVDTTGNKPLLDLGEFGFDMYTDGGDTGRVYVGTGQENIPIARLDEVKTAVTTIGEEDQTSVTVSDSYNTLLRVDGVVFRESVDYTIADNTTLDLTVPLEGGESIVELNVKDVLDTIRSKMAIPNGLATLDGTGLVPSSQLPSFVDDVIEVETYADLPDTGEGGKIYVVVADENDGDDTSTYRWSGSTYALVSNTLTGADIKLLYEGESDTNAFTDDEKTKLEDTEISSQLDDRDTANRNTDNHVDGSTNGVYTLTERDKLAAIEEEATADQTDAEIKTAYDNEYVQRTDSNYIDTATNIDEVVDLLDVQAKVEEDSRIAVDNKVLYLVPATDTNPVNGVGTIAIDSGRMWICTDSTDGANVWADVTKANNIEEWD